MTYPINHAQGIQSRDTSGRDRTTSETTRNIAAPNKFNNDFVLQTFSHRQAELAMQSVSLVKAMRSSSFSHSDHLDDFFKYDQSERDSDNQYVMETLRADEVGADILHFIQGLESG